MKDYIHRYLQLPQAYDDIAALYVLLTWVYEFARSVPYLRVIGDWGSGKTRFLEVVGSICFRPIFASGATTPSPIFRILDMFHGTLILDEADFADSSAQAEIIKIFNNGYRPGFPVVRSEKDNRRWRPETFHVFSPKLIATRSAFKDQALESRCLTADMLPLNRTDIPIFLPRSFPDEVNDLRSKLLTFRLANLLKLRAGSFDNELVEPGLQPRLQEILLSLKSMANGDSAMAETLSAFVHQQQDTLFSQRRDSRSGLVLAAMMELREEGFALTAKNIAERVNQTDDEVTINAQKVGWMARKLGFRKERSANLRVIRWDEQRLIQLAPTYGLTISSTLPLEKLSLLPSLSQPASKTDDNVDETMTMLPTSSQTLSQAGPLFEDDNDDDDDDSVGDKRTFEDDDEKDPCGTHQPVIASEAWQSRSQFTDEEEVKDPWDDFLEEQENEHQS